MIVRIALFVQNFFPELSGVPVVLWERIQKISQTNHQVLIFCSSYIPFQEIYPNFAKFHGKLFPNVELIYLPSKPFMCFRDYTTLKSGNYKEVAVKLDAFKPDVIHCDGPERLYFGTNLVDSEKGWSSLLTVFKLLPKFVDTTNIAIIIAGYGPLENEIMRELTK